MGGGGVEGSVSLNMACERYLMISRMVRRGGEGVKSLY